jgi:polyribonucleotide nucleotidyltransferase
LDKSLFNLLVAGKKGSINMIECGANEVPEAILKEAYEIGQKEIDKICDIQSEFLNKLVIKEQEVIFNKPSESVIAYISNILTEDKLEALTGKTKVPFNDLFNQYKSEVLELAKERIESDSADDEEFTESKIKM